MPITYPYIQYGGVWTTSQANDAVASGTWAVPPQPHLYGWGLNNNGALGLGNTTNYSSPKQVGSLTNWLNIASSTYSLLSVKTDGTLWACGSNIQGQLGLGNTTNYSSPKHVGALTNWASVSGSYVYSYGIKTDGTLWAWGYNVNGQLGIGTNTNVSSPTQVGALTNWKFISSIGSFGAAAIKTDGTLWTWGQNYQGCLGLGNTTNYSSPKQVGGLTTWVNLSGGGSGYVIAVKTNGTLWAWGKNTNGQLGLGNITSYSSPIQVGALTNWGNAITGNSFTIAVKTDNTLWTWGQNNQGQLGLGNTTYYSSPKQVGILSNWSKTSAGYNYFLAIKTDGTLWGAGQNYYGQLGLGNTTNYSSPKQVGSLTTWLTVAAGYNATVLGIAKT
jgi:alpha-tubulin suppressor-like RCC1 family protein